MAMSALIKSLEDIMRKDAGLNGDAQYIEQITWLLFLKAFDAKEMEWEFRPDYHGVILEGLRWRDWAADKEGITGEALIAFVDKLFRELKRLDSTPSPSILNQDHIHKPHEGQRRQHHDPKSNSLGMGSHLGTAL